MKILNVSEIDQAKLAAFKSAEWPSVDDSHFDNRELVDFDEEEITFVAEDDKGDIAGYIKMRTEMGTCEIESLIVGKDSRKQGIASSLVLKVEEVCKDMGVHKIWLETGVDWEAKDLYEKLGYQTLTTLKDHYGHKDFILMEKFV